MNYRKGSFNSKILSNLILTSRVRIAKFSVQRQFQLKLNRVNFREAGVDGPQNCIFYNFSACSLHYTSKISLKSTSTKKGVYLQSTTKKHNTINCITPAEKANHLFQFNM